jgi:hypothetical protein
MKQQISLIRNWRWFDFAHHEFEIRNDCAPEGISRSLDSARRQGSGQRNRRKAGPVKDYSVRMNGKRRIDKARTISNDEYRLMNDEGDRRVGNLVRLKGENLYPQFFPLLNKDGTKGIRRGQYPIANTQ